MSVTANPLFVTDCLEDSLTQCDTDVFDGMMVVDMQVALCLYIQIDQTVTCDLVKHVVEKRNAGRKILSTGSVQIDCHVNFCLVGIADDFRGSGR